MTTHAKFSPSSCHRWIRCAASIVIEDTLPDSTSAFAIEGTAAHALAETILRRRLRSEDKIDAIDYLGTYPESGTIQVDHDMVDNVQTYVDTVWHLAMGKELYIERKVDFSNVIQVANSFGTADAIIVSDDELQIHDLKYGRGVKVDAYENEQLMLYALGALEEFDLLYDFKKVILFIHQPRLNHISEWEVSLEHLRGFGIHVRDAAEKAIRIKLSEPNIADFNPGEKQCRWCKAAGGLCKAQRDFIYSKLSDSFDDHSIEFKTTLDNNELVDVFRNLKLITNFCTSVENRVFNMLHSGQFLEGLKLVQGRGGKRIWQDEEATEKLFKSFKLKQNDIYVKKLISPTQAEKLLKDSRCWPKVETLIVRSEGKPTVVNESDPRPAIVITDDFEVVEDEN